MCVLWLIEKFVVRQIVALKVGTGDYRTIRRESLYSRMDGHGDFLRSSESSQRTDFSGE